MDRICACLFLISVFLNSVFYMCSNKQFVLFLLFHRIANATAITHELINKTKRISRCLNRNSLHAGLYFEDSIG